MRADFGKSRGEGGSYGKSLPSGGGGGYGYFLEPHIAKNFVANEHHSFTFVFTFSVVGIDLPTDCNLSFLSPTETDILSLVFSQSTDVVIVNFVMVLKFPNDRH